MPSKRIQTVISVKGLMTIPSPYRSFIDLRPGDDIVVRWNKILTMVPAKVEESMSDDEKFLMEACLQETEFTDLIIQLWKRLDQSDQDELLMDLTQRARATVNVMECSNCKSNIDSGYRRKSDGAIFCNTCSVEAGIPHIKENQVWRL